MRIDDELIAYLEGLTRLRLSEEEKKRTKGDLEEILSYIDRIGRLDTQGVEPLFHPFPFTNIFRQDLPEASLDRELILSNAPERKNGCFKVPKTVEQGG